MKTKIKNGFSLSKTVFLVVAVLIYIGPVIAMFFIGGYKNKLQNIPLIIAALTAGFVMDSIYHEFFMKQKDERNIEIVNKAKAKAFDIMKIIIGILIITYALLKENLLTIALVVAAYCLIFTVYLICYFKYKKKYR